MKTASVTEFRSNIKKYLDIAQTEELVIHQSKSQSFVLVPLDAVSKKISLLRVKLKKTQ
jgi:PHD/YefM family antitoxin component YafN of YafNO toxin-antitoxin module